MDVRAATQHERPRIRALLAGAALPVQDLETARIDFLVALGGGEVVGAIGRETFEDTGLLRSLVVCDAQRGRGTGGHLVAALEAQAKASGLRRLVLLTQTAESFFARRGYRAIARDAAPAAVRESGEFRSLCPASATCMLKELA